jgi:hypothetical protein
MLHVGNFNPEWGYLAPAPSLLRTLRLVVVAAVVGATVGAAVVFALARQPGAEESVATRTLVQHAETDARSQTLLTAELQAQAGHVSTADAQHAPGVTARQSAPAVALADTGPSAANDSIVASTAQRATIAADLAETPKTMAKAATAKATTAKATLAPAASGVAPVSVSDAARVSKTPNKKSMLRAKDQEAKNSATGAPRIRVAMVAQHANKTAPQPSANNVPRNSVVPDNPDNNDVRNDDSLLARTMGVTDHVIAATHRAVSTIGVIPSLDWIDRQSYRRLVVMPVGAADP